MGLVRRCLHHALEYLNGSVRLGFAHVFCVVIFLVIVLADGKLAIGVFLVFFVA